MASKLQNNNTSLEEILAAINALPEEGSGGVDLPELSNPGVADDLVVGKQLIDGDGGVVTGTNPYEKASTDAEVNEQTDLLQQITTTLAGKTAVTPTLQSKTVTPTTSSQNIMPDSGYDGLSKVTVNAIPNTYIKPASTKAEAIYTPTTIDQTIAEGTYLTGTQTIKGDVNLIAANIAKGISIFGITGTMESGGGGGSAESCTIEFGVIDYSSDAPCYLYYTKPDFSVGYTAHYPDQSDPMATTSITVLKNSIACLMCDFLDIFSLSLFTSGGVEVFENGAGYTNMLIIRDNGAIRGSHG